MFNFTVKNIQKFVFTTLNTPLGLIAITSSELGLTGLLIQPGADRLAESLAVQGVVPVQGDNAHLRLAVLELTEYFSGKAVSFSVSIDWQIMPPFQRKVLQYTYKIPYGSTRTYSQIAQEIGHPKAARAVGQAQARNPVPVIIPCHRVIGKDGKLHGYGAAEGLKTKAYLLQLEGAL